MYPCKWGDDRDVDPRRPFAKARMIAELSPEQIQKYWPFPNGDNLPAEVRPAVLLPHDPSPPRLAIIDLDGVRDSDTERVTGEALQILDHVGGYAEVSPSGTGIHLFVKASLPDAIDRFSAPLREAGQIEIYDKSRFLASTWHHVAGTPTETVPENQEAVDQLLVTYADASAHRVSVAPAGDAPSSESES